VPTKFDAYKPIIEAQLTLYSEHSAVRSSRRNPRRGDAGGYTPLKAFVRRARFADARRSDVTQTPQIGTAER